MQVDMRLDRCCGCNAFKFHYSHRDRLFNESTFEHSPHSIGLHLSSSGWANAALRCRNNAGIATDSAGRENGNRTDRNALEAHTAESRLTGPRQKLLRLGGRGHNDAGCRLER
jgi:hypothetical protein